MFLVDIPPTYDDAFEPPESDLDTSGQWFRGPRYADRHGSLPSNPAVTGVSHSADRSSSLQHGRPPRLRGHRHYSDVTDPHRRKRYVTYIYASLQLVSAALVCPTSNTFACQSLTSSSSSSVLKYDKMQHKDHSASYYKIITEKPVSFISKLWSGTSVLGRMS